MKALLCVYLPKSLSEPDLRDYRTIESTDEHFIS